MGRSDPNSQIDLAHLAIWARRAPPGPATYLPHPTNGCPAWPSSQGAWEKPCFARGPLGAKAVVCSVSKGARSREMIFGAICDKW